MVLKIADESAVRETSAGESQSPQQPESLGAFMLNELLIEFKGRHVLALRLGNDAEGPYEVLASGSTFGSMQHNMTKTEIDGADEWLTHINVDEVVAATQKASLAAADWPKAASSAILSDYGVFERTHEGGKRILA